MPKKIFEKKMLKIVALNLRNRLYLHHQTTTHTNMTTYTFATKKEALAKHEELFLTQPNVNWDIFKNTKTGLFHIVSR